VQPREGGEVGGRPDHPQPPPGLPLPSRNIPSLIERLESENDQYWKKAIADQQKSAAESRKMLKRHKEEHAARTDAQIAEMRAAVAHLPPDNPRRLASERFIKSFEEGSENWSSTIDELATACGVANS
jgi:hypothetical protein